MAPETPGGGPEDDAPGPPAPSPASPPPPTPGGASEDDALVLDIDGFEGPIDLLLTLARAQKVDMARISVAQLADSYLEYIRRAQGRNLELAADYLVMAAWLAYLKSRLLVAAENEEEEEEPSAEELAEALTDISNY